MSTTELTPLAADTLAGLRKLMAGYKQRSCGGFTTDDMKWIIGKVFVDLDEALSELEAAKLIRFTGFDETAAEGACTCYVPC